MDYGALLKVATTKKGIRMWMPFFELNQYS